MTNRIINIFAFTALTLLWLVFLAAMLLDPDSLDAAWQTFRAWPLVAQVVVGLLTLPVVLGLWIWQMPWPWLLRVVLDVGLAGLTVYMFFPRSAPGQTGASTDAV